MDWLALAIGAGGLVASIAGLIFAFLARRAAKSAEQAAREARNSVGHTLCLVSAQRALSTINRLRNLHRESRWDAALELYQELRTLINDIRGTTPQEFHQSRAELDSGLRELRVIQLLVENAVSQDRDPAGLPVLSETLNLIETNLETLISNMMPPRGQEGELDG